MKSCFAEHSDKDFICIGGSVQVWWLTIVSAEYPGFWNGNCLFLLSLMQCVVSDSSMTNIVSSLKDDVQIFTQIRPRIWSYRYMREDISPTSSICPISARCAFHLCSLQMKVLHMLHHIYHWREVTRPLSLYISACQQIALSVPPRAVPGKGSES